MPVKCRNCGQDINFKKIETNPHLKGMYTAGKPKWVPINVTDSKDHFPVCRKTLTQSFYDTRNKIIICLDCQKIDCCFGHCLDWDEWLEHSKVYGHISYEKWNINNFIKKCSCKKHNTVVNRSMKVESNK